MKTQRISGFAVIEQIFESAYARSRIAANYLCIIIVPFVKDLLVRGFAQATIRLHVEVVEHFGQWLQHRGISLQQLSTLHVERFLQNHLPRCRCRRPATKRRRHCQAALRRLVEFLRARKQIREWTRPLRSPGRIDRLIAAYDQHMNQVCGFAATTRHTRQVCARRFMQWRFGRGPLQWPQLHRQDLSRFVAMRARHLGPAGIRSLACLDLICDLRFAMADDRMSNFG